ncbi:MAG: MFS transporter [Gemmatimonas sp.]
MPESSISVSRAPVVPETPLEQAAFSKAAARLLPLLFACYIVAYLDRVNVGFAKLQMVATLEFSDTVYGFGAGIFFLGYFLFEVPSNLILERVGARRWIARIMITWAIVSGSFAFVAVIPWGPLPALFGLSRIEFSFYALRLLLGIAEAGFFPGIILYLTYWFPAARRARTVALFMTAVAVANVIGAPLSGAIMQYMDGWSGWAGWRWLFVVEAVPSLIAGIVVLVWLPDRPANAPWLRADERQAITSRIAADNDARGQSGDRHGVRAAFSDVRVWALAFVYLTIAFALYATNFWMPTLVQEFGADRTDYVTVGLITMIPWGLGGIAMVIVGSHSDRTEERRWHVSGSLLVAALGLTVLAMVGNNAVWSVVALSLVTCGVLSTFATFWSLPTAFLSPTAAAAGIAWINSVGNLGGHFGPDLIGRIRDATGTSSNAFVVLALMAISGSLVTLWVTRVSVQRHALHLRS